MAGRSETPHIAPEEKKEEKLAAAVDGSAK
jgi:hypothetical protein